MSPEMHPQFVWKEPIVHPRQQYLKGLLERPDLPQGADELICEAIVEYESVFERPPVARPDTRTAPTTFRASMPDDGEDGVILAGKNHLLTVKFSADDEHVAPLDEVFTHTMVVLNLRNMPGVNLYPDFLRYVAVDVNGNSKPTQFLLEVPDGLRGYNGRIELDVFNGTRLTFHRASDIQLR